MSEILQNTGVTLWSIEMTMMSYRQVYLKP